MPEVAHPPLEEGHLLQVFLDCMAAMEASSLEVSAVPACLSVLELEVSVAVQPHAQVCLQEVSQLVQEPAKRAHDLAPWAQDPAT